MQLKPNSANLHMYIAGEEVVCNNKIEIIEQLTNTNSVILNNCYPLSWEQDKDYVSRYYMPKDYSLFKMVYDFDEDVYGEELEVYLLYFKRPEMRFDSVDALMKQMSEDIEEGRKYHSI